MTSNTTTDPIYNNYIEYMIYNNQLDNYNTDELLSNYYNGKSTNSYNYYVSQISPNDDTKTTFGTDDNVDTKQHYRKEIKDNRIKINNYNNFSQESQRKFKLHIYYKKLNEISSNIMDFELDEEFSLSVKQFKNKLDKTKSIMVNFNPIKVYDVDTTARGIDDPNTTYYITEIKLVPINKYIIPDKFLPKEEFNLTTTIDNYNYIDNGNKIYNGNKFNQILIYYDDNKIGSQSDKCLSIQSCSLNIDTSGNISFQNLDFITFNKIINFYIDKFIITY